VRTHVSLCEENIGLVEKQDAAPSMSQPKVTFHVSFDVFWAVPDVSCCWSVSCGSVLQNIGNLPQVMGYSGFFVCAATHSAVDVFPTPGTPCNKIMQPLPANVRVSGSSDDDGVLALTFPADQIHACNLLPGSKPFCVCFHHGLHHLSVAGREDKIVPFVVLLNRPENI
jgi:hypothetical protein